MVRILINTVLAFICSLLSLKSSAIPHLPLNKTNNLYSDTRINVKESYKQTNSNTIFDVVGFDGIDDYISRPAFLGGKSEVTMMTWFKLDKNSDGGEILGQKNFRIYVDSNLNLKTYLRTNTNESVLSTNQNQLNTNTWYHVVLNYNGNTGQITLFLNGNNIWSYDNSNIINSFLNNTNEWNANYDFEIGRNSETHSNYFEGSIYETRIYNKSLSTSQIQKQVHQEIINSSGNIKGSIIPKDIDGLLWSDLLLYYKMLENQGGYTKDYSYSNISGRLNAMTISQDFTAPLPYITKEQSEGNWNDSNNWIHGNVWDINSSMSPASIVKIQGNIQTNSNVSTVGLIIASTGKLEITNNSQLLNTWYTKLDGFLDLQEDSQLIQTEESTLDSSSTGTLERDQKGNKNLYSYSYMSSPVGRINSVSNNNSYRLPEVLHDGSLADLPLSANFLSSGYDGALGNPGTTPISIADYWIWKCVNKSNRNYSTWQHVRSTGTLSPGEGYTMKGVKNSVDAFTENQNYVFKGKPNNGDITITLSKDNDYLLGNPYPSVIDANEFILDNLSTENGGRSSTNIIHGVLYYWDHFSVSSHNTSGYNGGYAAYSLIGGVPGLSHDSRLNATGGYNTKKPERYIPISQAFFINADEGGLVKFRNKQRVFKTEVTHQSIINKTSSSKQTEDTLDNREKIYLNFDSPDGYHRQLLLGTDDNASVNFDDGYDAALIDTIKEDMFWVLDDTKLVIQGIDNFNLDQKLPLGIKTLQDGEVTIKINKLENITDNTNIFLYDKVLNVYTNLKLNNYTIELPSGEYLERFEITFTDDSVSLSIDDFTSKNNLKITYINSNKTINIENPNLENIESVELHNTLGQSILKFDSKDNQTHLKYKTNSISIGTYIINVKTDYGKQSKKISIQ